MDEDLDGAGKDLRVVVQKEDVLCGRPGSSVGAILRELLLRFSSTSSIRGSSRASAITSSRVSSAEPLSMRTTRYGLRMDSRTERRAPRIPSGLFHETRTIVTLGSAGELAAGSFVRLAAEARANRARTLSSGGAALGAGRSGTRSDTGGSSMRTTGKPPRANAAISCTLW